MSSVYLLELTMNSNSTGKILRRELPLAKHLLIAIFFGFCCSLTPGLDAGNESGNSSSKGIPIITYNVQFLPGLARAKNKRAYPNYRARQIAEKMSAFEIVALRSILEEI